MRKKSVKLIKLVATDTLGVLCLLAAAAFGWLPGPGGIPLALAGFWLLSRNHEWARQWLHNFDEKRVYYTDKYLVGHTAIRILLDLLALVFILNGVLLMSDFNDWLFEEVGWALIAVGTTLILINQKRIDRIINSAKRLIHKRSKK